MRKLIKTKLLVLLFVSLFCTSNKAHSTIDDNTVTDFVFASFDNIVEVALQDQNQDLRSQIVDGLKKRVDLKAISRFILGRHWRNIDVKIQLQFTEIVSEYLVEFFHTYFSLVFDVTQEKLVIGRIIYNNDGETITVISKIKGIRVNWQLVISDQGKLLTRDVIVKDFSVLFALSNEVRKEIRSYGSLAALLQAKTKS